MLRLYEYGATTTTSAEIGTTFGMIGSLNEAVEVRVSKEINAEYTLEFKYPINGRNIKKITVNRIVECEGQLYRIITISNAVSDGTIEVTCRHVYDADACTTHIPTIGGTAGDYGVSPIEIIRKAFEGTKFTVLSYDNVQALGLEWVGADGFKIDFEVMDKTSPASVMEKVIENCGFGEIYKDNYNIALVKSVGGFDRAVASMGTLKLSPTKNLSALRITRDISGIVNRLYPYGESDATITSITGVPYIDSEDSIEKYGLKVGYKDYSDYKNPMDILSHAQWEFHGDNPDRLDLPTISIEGTVIDLSRLAEFSIDTRFGKFEKPELGKGVKVTDIDGTEYTERITKITYYPYEPNETTVTIGHIQRDETFYISQMGKFIGFKWRIF